MQLKKLFALVFCVGFLVETVASEIKVVLPQCISNKTTLDLNAIIERGNLRVLVPYSKPDFFIKNGEPTGFMADVATEYLQFLNQGRNQHNRLTLDFIPMPFSDLIPALQNGRGDIAAAPFTITEDRLKLVDIVSGGKLLVDEVLVSLKDKQIDSLNELSSLDVIVVKGSSHVLHLNHLNDDLISQNIEPINIIEADKNLSSVDLLAMVDVGAYDYIIMDDFKAKIWQSLYENVVIHTQIPLYRGGQVGWAIRKDSPELKNSLTKFSEKVKKGSLLGNILFNKYFEDRGQFSNPSSSILNKNSQLALAHFKKYAERYNFDYIAIAAQAYQESRLDNSVVSSVGAVGVMQLLPTTAKDMGFNDISSMEDNIHAGVKYLAYLRDNFIKDKQTLDESDFYSFLWAAYNAGPGRLMQLRKHADTIGLNSNQWYDNVEYAALDKVGTEPVNYVSNIFKYYLIYSSALLKASEISSQP